MAPCRKSVHGKDGREGTDHSSSSVDRSGSNVAGYASFERITGLHEIAPRLAADSKNKEQRGCEDESDFCEDAMVEREEVRREGEEAAGLKRTG